MKNLKISKEEKELIINFLVDTIFYGLVLTAITSIVFGIKFHYYNFIGYGLFYWFMKKEGIKLLRKLWFR